MQTVFIKKSFPNLTLFTHDYYYQLFETKKEILFIMNI